MKLNIIESFLDEPMRVSHQYEGLMVSFCSVLSFSPQKWTYKRWEEKLLAEKEAKYCKMKFLPWKSNSVAFVYYMGRGGFFSKQERNYRAPRRVCLGTSTLPVQSRLSESPWTVLSFTRCDGLTERTVVQSLWVDPSLVGEESRVSLNFLRREVYRSESKTSECTWNMYWIFFWFEEN